ncbi:hypothetical protein SAMN04489858_11763, partial [Paracoccus homiensis]
DGGGGHQAVPVCIQELVLAEILGEPKT